MKRTSNRLSATEVKTKKGPGTYADGDHLYLAVDANGNRRFVFIYARNGRQREISLGTSPAVSLADARKKREQMNATLARGEPLAGPRQTNAQTFKSVAEEVIKRRSKAWRGGMSAGHWRTSIEQHCAPLLERSIANIGLEDVLAVLRPLYDRAPNFAAITRARVEEIFDFAQARGWLPQDRANPADQRRLKILLPPAPKAVPRAALPYADVPALVAELQAIPLADARVVAARALEFVILTALRAREACGAKLSEFDFDKALLVVPADRMKAGVAHATPLSRRTIQIVEELAPLRGAGGVVFPATQRTGKAIDTAPLLHLLKALRPGYTTHGMRSAFRDWAGDCTAYPREVAESALAHVVGGVEGSYRRGSALEKRRELMNQWAAFCGGEDQQAAKVVPLRR